VERDGLQEKNWCAAAVSILLCLSIGGCEKNPERETDIKGLQHLSQQAWMPSDARERTRTVIAKYQDHVRDQEPILIVAVLIKIEGSEKCELGLWAFDENRDLAGFAVREESHDPNGRVITLEEHYPVFAHDPAIGVFDHCPVPVHIRDAHQRKDEKQWADYLAIDFDRLVRERVPNRSSPNFWDGVWRLWEETLPAVWVSLPEAGKVDVSLYVYDEAGHKSNVVNLLVHPPGNREPPQIAVPK
jgi:hypothetical protein